jgi:hypothetical protein
VSDEAILFIVSKIASLLVPNDGLLQVGYDNYGICSNDCHNSRQTEYLLPKQPVILVLHPLEKKLPERIDRGFPRKAIINVLVILIGFEPEFIGIGKEQQAKKQKDQDKSE